MLGKLIKRNVNMFFKDKGLFFTAMITPLILLVLYMTFLSEVYKDSFAASIPPMLKIDENLIEALAGGQLVSSLLAVCGVTVAFCSNMLMVQDKVTGAAWDFNITPLKRSTKAIGYYVASFLSTFGICAIAGAAGLGYLASVGWYLTAADVAMMFVDTLLVVVLGTAVSSIAGFFMSSQGQIAAVGSIVSSCYGFLCGAYMPISQFPEWLQKTLAFMPGTYATSLLRTHCTNGVFEEMAAQDVPAELITSLKDMLDSNVYFFDECVPTELKLVILGGMGLLLMGVYVVLNVVRKK
ncbi:MAG: ABC transporter permease [Clostridia bacterium]|nr:ABC transporter permease [Clostridia bacterium]